MPRISFIGAGSTAFAENLLPATLTDFEVPASTACARPSWTSTPTSGRSPRVDELLAARGTLVPELRT